MAGDTTQVIFGAPQSANILNGYQTFAATTGATTLITVPAGRMWVGAVGACCAVGLAAASTVAGLARAVFATAGANAIPAAGTVFAIEARAGANAVAGTVGSQGTHSSYMPLRVLAPAGNSATVTVVTTQTGTNATVDAWASGVLT